VLTVHYSSLQNLAVNTVMDGKVLITVSEDNWFSAGI